MLSTNYSYAKKLRRNYSYYAGITQKFIVCRNCAEIMNNLKFRRNLRNYEPPTVVARASHFGFADSDVGRSPGCGA